MKPNWTNEDELAEFIRQSRERGAQIEEDLTAEELRLIPPLAKPSKAKKQPASRWLVDSRLALIVAGLHPLAPPFLSGIDFAYRDDLDELTTAALRAGDCDFWLAVAHFTRKAEAVFSGPDTASHIAVYAIKAKKALHAKLGRLPTKGAVAALVISMRKAAGLGAPAIDSKEEWRRIFEIARLKGLPQDRPGRVKARE